MKKYLLVILGPTASGKTTLSINLAQKYNGEIICADSRSVYQKLDIGTAKPSKEEQKKVPHYLLDVAELGEFFTVAQFKKMANRKIKEIFKRNKTPFLVGGSGLYIDSVIFGLSMPEVAPDWKLRAKLEELSTDKLCQKIKNLDPEFFEIVDKNNRRRLIRAIEIMEKTGKKYSDLRKKNPPKYPILILGLDIPRDKLVANIDKRVDQRIEEGMIEEVRNLIEEDKVDPRWLDSLGLEYRFLSRYILGKLTKEEAINQLKIASHQFARRQMTWFRKNKNIVWIKNQQEAEKEIEKSLK